MPAVQKVQKLPQKVQKYTKMEKIVQKSLQIPDFAIVGFFA